MGWIFTFSAILIFGGFIYRAYRVWSERFADRGSDYGSREMEFVVKAKADLQSPPAVSPNAGASRPEIPVRSPRDENRPATAARKPIMDATMQQALHAILAEAGGFPVLAQVDIASLLQGPAQTIPRVTANFVICRKDYMPAVVVFIDQSTTINHQQTAENLLREAGIRVLKWERQALPDRDTIRAQLFKRKAQTQ